MAIHTMYQKAGFFLEMHQFWRLKQWLIIIQLVFNSSVCPLCHKNLSLLTGWELLHELRIQYHTAWVAKGCQRRSQKKYSKFRKYAMPIFDRICFANFELGGAWLKASLGLQHILDHHPKNWTLLAQKNGRAVQLIFSHNVSSTFTTKS